MMPCDYVALDGSTRRIDLDAVFDIVASHSRRRDGWTATLIYVPATRAFVELRSSSQDVRGDSQDEAEEVDHQYMLDAFGLTQSQLDGIMSSPGDWRFVDREESGNGAE
jgi:hypothetical protein